MLVYVAAMKRLRYLFYFLIQFNVLNYINGFSYEIEMSSVECSQSFDSKIVSSGFITSPNYPSPYPNELFCVYEFFGDINEKVILIIEDFELESPALISILQSDDSNTRKFDESEKAQLMATIENSDNFETEQCFYDYFDIYSYNVLRYYEFRKRYCGTRIEKQIIASSPRFRIVFSTNDNLQYRGFKLKFYFSLINIMPFVTSKICGNNNITGDGGVLKSPNYPSMFPSNLECAWTITVDTEKKILIKFIDLNFNEECHLSYVHIYDGYVNNVAQPDLIACQKLSFYLRSEKYIQTKTNRVVIKFNGDKANSTDSLSEYNLEKSLNSSKKDGKSSISFGFLIAWSAFHESEDCQEEFKCKGGEFCIDSNKVLCTKTNSYCISKKLVCDGYSHCNIGDKSDEINCGFLKSNINYNTKLNVIVAFIFFIVIFFSFLTYILLKMNLGLILKCGKSEEISDEMVTHINSDSNRNTQSIDLNSTENKEHVSFHNSKSCPLLSPQTDIENNNDINLQNIFTKSTDVFLLYKNDDKKQVHLNCIDVCISNIRSNSYIQALNKE